METVDIKNISFNEKGLVPAIVQDARSGEILMMAYMNQESLQKTIETGETWFFSRSRQKLWHKGEESAHFQHVKKIFVDCDADTLVVQVIPDGPACHTGEESCFHHVVGESDTLSEFNAECLMSLIAGRKFHKKEGSYTTYLFEKGIDKILKKVGEECTEVIIAGKAGDRKETIYEIADLAYHVMVLMTEMGISLEDIHQELASRHVIDKKVKQEKMV